VGVVLREGTFRNLKEEKKYKMDKQRSNEGNILFTPISRYVMYDKKTKLWISHRKRVYLVWFKFLQYCEKDDNFEVDWKKYSGWGGSNEVCGSKFDNWWKENWVELFGIKERGETPKFLTNPKTKISDFNSLRLYLLVYEYVLKYPELDGYGISQKIQERESFKRYPIPSFTEGLGFDGGVIDKRTVQRRMSNYRKRGKEIMDNICKGVFP